MKKDDSLKLNSADVEVLRAMTEFRDALKEGVPLEKKFTIRTVHLDLRPRDYQPADIKNVRKMFNLSQAVFAIVLGVSPKTIRAWEQGLKKPSPMASRFMDEMTKKPAYWLERIQEMVTNGGKTDNS